MSNEPEKNNDEQAKPKDPVAKAEDASSKETTESTKAPPKAPAKAATEDKKAEPPPPPSLGKYGLMLDGQGLEPTALGNDAGGCEMVEVKPVHLIKASQFLKDSAQSQFDLLISVSGVDWKTHRQAVYHLYSTKTFEKLVLKVNTSDDKIPSVYSVWPGSDWHEREAFDLYGIVFEGHPNLKRILMPTDWEGYPMRKDYKVDDPRLVWNER